MGKDLTDRKRWPNEADWARIDAIAMSIRARNALKLAMFHVNDPESLRNIFEAVECCREIESNLTKVGAKSDREEEMTRNERIIDRL